ncbi:MAG TPA: NUDIX domain-containing protein [candidate division Zixibacteria bacterium]|nr:NUDIX domain-containing protein [candidate division Zixibacteria bacterium]
MFKIIISYMKQFYVGIGAVVEKDNKFLVLKRSPNKDVGANLWEVVTGRLEAEELPEIGTIREVKEEVNLDVEILMPIDTGFFYRGGKEFPMVFILFWCKYLSGEVKISWEHSEYKWLSLEEAINNPDLYLYHSRFKIIKKLKQYLPENFKLNK